MEAIHVDQHEGVVDIRQAAQLGIPFEPALAAEGDRHPPTLQFGYRASHLSTNAQGDRYPFQLGREPSDVTHVQHGTVQIHLHVHRTRELIEVGPTLGHHMQFTEERRPRCPEVHPEDIDPMLAHRGGARHSGNGETRMVAESHHLQLCGDGIPDQAQSIARDVRIGDVHMIEVHPERGLFLVPVVVGKMESFYKESPTAYRPITF